MARSKVINIYRIEINHQYGWIASSFSPDQFEQVVNRQLIRAKNTPEEQQTALQQALLALDDWKAVKYQLLGTVGRDDNVTRARIILRDLQTHDPATVISQRIPGLYFCGLSVAGANQDNISLPTMTALMHKYSQVDFGWPHDVDTYNDEMTRESDNLYSQRRTQVLKYWFDAGNGDLSWLYPSSVTDFERNYNQAFAWLKQNAPEITNWYYDQPTDTTGLIWHFTDINNMANILSYQEITSKNWGQQQQLIKNDNAASSVNDAATKPWVHDFARFYLRPQTPTQYRNEGIYQYYGDHPDFSKLPKSLTNYQRTGFWTTGKPAHLPVPVFIGFSLRKFLQQGGHLVKGSLAGKHVADQPTAMFDDDAEFLKTHIHEIYGRRSEAVWMKHTEFIFPQRMTFTADDILRIVVRSEAEKLVLLTMLTEHDSALFSDQQTHQKIDPQQYIDRIVVDPGFFYYNGSTIQVNSAATDDSVNQYHLGIQPPVQPANLVREEVPFTYQKRVRDSKLHVSVPQLKRITLKVRDVNNELKIVARFHDPDWILGVNKWIPSRQIQKQATAKGHQIKNRYYSSLYHHGQYYKLWREEGSIEWYDFNTKQVATFLQPRDCQILKTVEESCQARFTDENDTGMPKSSPSQLVSQAGDATSDEATSATKSLSATPQSTPKSDDDNWSQNIPLFF